MNQMALAGRHQMALPAPHQMERLAVSPTAQAAGVRQKAQVVAHPMGSVAARPMAARLERQAWQECLLAAVVPPLAECLLAALRVSLGGEALPPAGLLESPTHEALPSAALPVFPTHEVRQPAALLESPIPGALTPVGQRACRVAGAHQPAAPVVFLVHQAHQLAVQPGCRAAYQKMVASAQQQWAQERASGPASSAGL